MRQRMMIVRQAAESRFRATRFRAFFEKLASHPSGPLLQRPQPGAQSASGTDTGRFMERLT